MRCWWIVLMCLSVGVMAQPDTDGPTRYHFPNGRVSSEGTLINGKPEGYWKTYYENGELRSEGSRKDMLLDSVWRFYDEKGRIQSEITYLLDKKDGPSRKYDTTGVLLAEEFFAEGKREGTARYYHGNGQLQREVPFKQGLEDGRGYEYAEDGRVVTMLVYGAGMLRRREDINRIDRAGLKQGPWKEFHSNGKVKWEGNYVDGNLQGVVKTYDNLGGLRDMTKYDGGAVDSTAQEKLTVDIRRTFHPNGKVASLGSYSKSGKREGLFREFDAAGNAVSAKIYSSDRLVSEGSVNDVGAMQGPWTEYFATGEKRAEGTYEGGRREGDWTFFHRSGKAEQKGKYQNGLPQGKWQWFYEEGRMHREEFYRRGREDGASVEYDEEGKLITQGEYIDGLKDGKWFYEVGDHKEEGAYKDGLKDGPWVYTYDNGQRNFTGEFVNGEPHGKHKWYWPNGRLKLEGRYSMGLEQGDFTHYNEYGYPMVVIRFKDGAEIKIDGERIPPPYFPGEGSGMRD